jgi:hypothetical protein
VVELGIDRDNSKQLLLLVEPQRLTSPDQACDAVALECDLLAMAFDLVLPRCSMVSTPEGKVCNFAGEPCASQ